MNKKAIISAAFLIPTIGFGAGYQLNLQGLRELAMGGGGCAQTWDASAIFYNPAALSQLKGFQLNANVMALVPNTQFIQNFNGASYRTTAQTFTPFNLYLGGTVGKAHKLGLGLGVYTPFGSGTKWEDGWTGRFITQSISLQTIFFQPTISYKLSEMVSVGGGFVYGTGNVNLTKNLPVQNTAGEYGLAELKGKASGTGFNLGIHLKADEQWQFGLDYRSRVDMKVNSGTINFSHLSPYSTTLFPNTNFKSALPMPSVLTVGVQYKPIPKLSLQADFNFVSWNVYDTLRFDYEVTTSALQNTREARLYHNTISARVGMHYQATDRFALMFGAAYDPTPVRSGFVSPDLPDADRIVGTGGFSYKIGKKLDFLAALEYSKSQKRMEADNNHGLNGRYQSKAIVAGIGFTYKF